MTRIGFGSFSARQEASVAVMSAARGECQGVLVTSWLGGTSGLEQPEQVLHLLLGAVTCKTGWKGCSGQPSKQGGSGLEGNPKSHILELVMRDAQSHSQGPGCPRRMPEYPWLCPRKVPDYSWPWH